ncbi:MAG: hypothetical protein P4L85_01720 [Paludisphaera borealis]|uniref:hypothetical protein n=1 Tax=Paludisphaera borealis TaxID=1387353 RepID=UPI002842EDE6|nr:hypothetical protein [Paludisphaera borealis]MDR3618038.1 hypothetical protein [Paludisphaera borealis]
MKDATTAVRLGWKWVGRGASTAAEGRRRGARRTSLGRLERLEDRTLLSTATIDADGLLTLDTDAYLDIYNHIKISNSGDVFSISSNTPVDFSDGVVRPTFPGDALYPGLLPYRVEVTGVTGLTVNMLNSASVHLESANVPTTINVLHDGAHIAVGGDVGTVGLKGVTKHVSINVTAADDWQTNGMTIYDRGAHEGADYTITANTVEATGGFGGVSFSGLDELGVIGSKAGSGETTRFNVLETPRGSIFLLSEALEGAQTIVDVNPTTAHDDGNLQILGGFGPNTFNIKATPSPMSLGTQSDTNIVNLTNNGSTAGIRHAVYIATFVMGYHDVVIDNSAGESATNAVLTQSTGELRTADLSGIGGPGGLIRLDPYSNRQVIYKAPQGLNNSLTVDFSNGALFSKVADAKLTYDGGYVDGTNSTSSVKLVGSPPKDPFTSETHVATGPGAGSLTFARAGGFAGLIDYVGLAPDGLFDLVPSTNYVFDYQGETDPGVLVQAGAAPGTLLITSQATPPAFVATTIANKTNVVIDTNGAGDLSTTVDYASATPVAGLSALTIVTSPNDQVLLAAAPPGVAVNVDPSATPRPGAIASPSNSTAVDSQSEVIVDPAPSVPAPEPMPPAAPTVSQPESPPVAQTVGADFIARFGSALRRSPGDRLATRSTIPAQRFAAARLARLAAFRARALVRPATAWHARSSMRDA